MAGVPTDDTYRAMLSAHMIFELAIPSASRRARQGLDEKPSALSRSRLRYGLLHRSVPSGFTNILINSSNTTMKKSASLVVWSGVQLLLLLASLALAQEQHTNNNSVTNVIIGERQHLRQQQQQRQQQRKLVDLWNILFLGA
jgi:hypothetical protein